jgi:hypothetical protein
MLIQLFPGRECKIAWFTLECFFFENAAASEMLDELAIAWESLVAIAAVECAWARRVVSCAEVNIYEALTVKGQFATRAIETDLLTGFDMGL